ncbi:MAG: 1-aminocyclopropane-1-carboxylate deaminase/D-cysteine desulfhydrase [Myxococcota bacterium]
MRDVPRLSLARLPTPVERLERLSETLGLDVRVKRDDLTGSHLSGNKIRKLETLLADARRRDATHVLTCGGAQSNHCRATALAAAPLGLQPVLLLRTPRGLPGDLPRPPVGNVLLDHLAGASIHTCDPAGYAERDARMASLAEAVRADGGRPYVIPEGGSDALGALGYVRAAHEIVDQTAGAPPTSVVVPTGSGGTLAGLALGFAERGVPVRAVGIPVGDDAATFRAIVRRIADEASDRFGLPALPDDAVDLVDGYQGRGYALSTPGELALIRDVARRDGLVLDPVYTGKAFGALLELARRSPDRLGHRPLFVHTGGLFGLFAFAEPLAPLL